MVAAEANATIRLCVTQTDETTVNTDSPVTEPPFHEMGLKGEVRHDSDTQGSKSGHDIGLDHLVLVQRATNTPQKSAKNRPEVSTLGVVYPVETVKF
jgi:hypothetical protein